MFLISRAPCSTVLLPSWMNWQILTSKRSQNHWTGNLRTGRPRLMQLAIIWKGSRKWLCYFHLVIHFLRKYVQDHSAMHLNKIWQFVLQGILTYHCSVWICAYFLTSCPLAESTKYFPFLVSWYCQEKIALVKVKLLFLAPSAGIAEVAKR